MKSKNYWTGKEIEGRLYGLDTIFLARDFKGMLNEAVKYPSILIGVGLIDELNYETSNNLSWQDIENLLDTGKAVTLEVKPHQVKKIPIQIKLKAHILLWIDVPEIAELKSSDSVKLCSQSHDMHVFTLFNGQRVTRDNYQHDKYETYDRK